MEYLIETPRLLLREILISDAEDMYILNSDLDVVRYTGDVPFSSIEETKEFISNYNHYHKYGYGRWAVILKETKEILGWCGLKNHDDEFIDLGYRFHQKHWGKGYATESAKACIEYGFNTLQMTEIIGRAMPENPASIAVLEKVGMKYWKEDECEGLHAAKYFRISKS
jgi:ribosomal-protein-alanine N-acetyltransferase